MTTPLPHRVGEVGVVFRVSFVDQDGAPVSLTGAATLELRFQSPKGVAKQLTAVAVSGTTLAEGQIEAATTVGFLDEVGWWKLQGHAAGSGWDFSTEISAFKTESNL